MKAAVYCRYGPPAVLQIKDVEKPIARNNQVLVRIHATPVSAADWRPGKIRILGMEFAGEVESVGQAVTRFGAGDQVFGSTGFKFGAHAE